MYRGNGTILTAPWERHRAKRRRYFEVTEALVTSGAAVKRVVAVRLAVVRHIGI